LEGLASISLIIKHLLVKSPIQFSFPFLHENALTLNLICFTRFSPPRITCDSLCQQTTCIHYTVLFILKKKFLSPFATESLYQRHTLRDRRHSTTACPACPMGTKELKKCTARKNKFCTGPTRAEQKSAQQVHKSTKKGPLSFVLFQPHSPQFQQSAGPPLSVDSLVCTF